MSYIKYRKMARKSRKMKDGSPSVQMNIVKTFDNVVGLRHCFICDSFISEKGTPLLMGSTPYSKISLPTKIGQLLGDGFMVIVTTDDVLCRRCSSLIIRLDKLETDIEVVRKALTGYLKMKYNLYDEEEVNHQFNDETENNPAIQDSTDGSDQYIFEATHDIDSEGEGNTSHVESHILRDLDVTGYKCMSCQYKTTSSAVFLEHLKIHSNEMYFKCSNCDTEFHSLTDIESHIMSVHYMHTLDFQDGKSDENKTTKIPLTFYECNVCKFQSSIKSIFDNHVLKHNKTPVYKCSICSKKLSSKTLLKTHIDTHNLLRCELCNLEFNERSILVEHLALHNISNDQFEEEQILVDSSENVDKYIQIAEDVKLEMPVMTSDSNKDDYVSVQEFLEQAHAENLVTDTSDICQSEQVNVSEQNAQVESSDNQQCPGESIKNEQELEQVPGVLQETSFLLENEIFGKDDDNNLSVNIDRNEGSETNNFLNDPSVYLGEFQPDSEKQEESQKTVNDEEKSTIAEKNEILENNTDQENNKEDIKDETSNKKVYVCSICGLQTHSETHIKRHFKIHVALENKIYGCHICNKVLTTRSNLNRHMLNHENCPGRVTCKLCNEELNDRLHLKQHLEDHHTGPQQCSVCDMEFTNKKEFKEHELTHPERAVQQILAQLHLRTQLEELQDDKKDGNVDEKVYKCHICSKILTTFHNLKRHMRNHEKSSGNVKCSMCSEELTDRLHLRQHMEDRHPETHQCVFCQKIFANKRTCKSHELTHPERFVYKCDICKKVFLNETRLEKHKAMFHRDPRCRYCEKEINDPVKLFNHERRHEMYKNKFPCQLCSKVFRTPSGLKYHMSVHTGKYAVYCEICGKGMHSEMILEEHKATHTKEIRYTCELCGRSFTSNSTYRMHRKWHDNPLPYKCKICDRKFKHTSILAVHMRRAHTGERPYKCPYCPYTFSVSGTLHKHIILHTKKYPYNCKLCPKGFTTRTKLARHMAKEHNDFEMLNAKPPPCEYKMVLKPSELPANPEEETSKEDSQESQLPESKFEEAVVEEQILDASQAIFLFQ